MKIHNKLLLILLCTSISACAPFHTSICGKDLETMAHETIYFGTGKKNGVVTKSEWLAFVDTIITPKFPEGLTVSEASGQWKGNDGVIIKEASYALTIIHDNSEAKVHSILEIIDTYKTKFQQEAVLRVKTSACVSF